MIAGVCPLLQQGLGVIGVFHILAPIVASSMAGNERVSGVEAEPIGRGFERERLASVVGRDGVAIGVEGNTKLPGSAPLGHRGDSEGMQRQRTERQPLFVPCLDRWAPEFRCAGAHWPPYRATGGPQD